MIWDTGSFWQFNETKSQLWNKIVVKFIYLRLGMFRKYSDSKWQEVSKGRWATDQ